MPDFNKQKIAHINGVGTPYDFLSTSPDYSKERLTRHAIGVSFLGTGYPLTIHGDPWRGDSQLRYFWKRLNPQPGYSSATAAAYDALGNRGKGREKNGTG